MDSEAFEAHRAHLVAVAYRMLGSHAEAEDAVQEAWLRYAAADRAAIVDLRAWLTRVTARICLDVLRSARVRRGGDGGAGAPAPGGRSLAGGPSPPPPPPGAPPHR